MKIKNISLIVISACILIMSLIISVIRGVSLTNTPLGTVLVIAFFIPLLVFFWKLSTDIKQKYAAVCYFIRFFEIIFVLILTITSLLVFSGVITPLK